MKPFGVLTISLLGTVIGFCFFSEMSLASEPCVTSPKKTDSHICARGWTAWGNKTKATITMNDDKVVKMKWELKTTKGKVVCSAENLTKGENTVPCDPQDDESSTPYILMKSKVWYDFPDHTNQGPTVQTFYKWPR